MSTPPDRLKEQVLARIHALPSPTRKQWLRTQAFTWLTLVALCGLVALGGGFDVLHHRPPGYVGSVAAAFGVCAVLSTAALLHFGTSLCGPSRAFLGWLNRMALPWLGFSTLTAQRLLPAELLGEYRYHAGCGLYIMLGGGALVMLFFSLLRGADPLTPKRSAVTVAVCAGSWLGLAVTLQCPVVATGHLLVAHVLPVAVVMLASARWGASKLGLGALRVAQHRSGEHRDD
jgi:hypothetical protein